MPELKNSKHEKFAQLIASGKTQDKAYVEAGYAAKSTKYARVKGCQLAKHHDIAERIGELKGLPENSIPKLSQLPGNRARKGREPIRAVIKAIKEKRQSDYDPEMANLVFRLCLLGATDIEIAATLQVTLKTWEGWKRTSAEMRDAINRGRLEADAHVANSLYHRAIGYSHPAVKIFMPAGADAPVYAPYTEYYPPDTAAASLWLRNRHQDLWKDRREANITGTFEFRLRTMTPEQREQNAMELYDRVQQALQDMDDEDGQVIDVESEDVTEAEGGDG